MRRIRIIMTIGAVASSGLLLAACGTAPAPHYGGGNNGGSPSSTPTTTAKQPGVPTTSVPVAPPRKSGDNAAIAVATDFVSANWSLNPAWPNPNYVYVLDRPFLTPAINAQNATQATRPMPTSLENHWLQDVRFKIGSVVDVASGWVVQDAGITPTTCVVEVMFTTRQTAAGVAQSTSRPSLKYAFHMNKVNGKWLVASQPELPE